MSTSLQAVVAELAALPTGPLPSQPTPARRSKAAPRTIPQRSEQFASYDLDALRAHRSELTTAESRVSYWRRILQARLDVLRSGVAPGSGDAAHLRPVLAKAREGLGRGALLDVLGDEDTSVLDLASLWDRQVDQDDPAGIAALEADLSSAETQLSAYRAALHERLGAVTGELIARYRENPSLCLVALPLPPARSGS